MTAFPVIAVTGLKTEARIVAGPRVHAIAGGGDAAGLARALEAAVARKASAIISFGVAGGLAPELAPGSRLIARTIIGEDGERYYGDPVWSKRLSGAFGGATIADIAGVAAPLACHKEKRALHIKTGAHAADMESHIAARIAVAHKLPFAAFRVVADPAHRQLPHAAGMSAAVGERLPPQSSSATRIATIPTSGATRSHSHYRQDGARLGGMRRSAALEGTTSKSGCIQDVGRMHVVFHAVTVEVNMLS